MEEYSNANPYVYCLQNPIIFMDPDGRDIINADKRMKEKVDAVLVVAKSNFDNYINSNKLSGLSRREIKKILGKEDYQSSVISRQL